jgi:hypothetical protein
MSENKLVPFGGNGSLTEPTRLAAALQGVARQAAPQGMFLRMGKDGVWVIGIEMEPVAEGAEFAVNPAGFGHGWIAWGKSERLGESFVPLTDPLPPTPATPEGAVRGWEQQFGMHLREVGTGADLIFRTSSVGGKRAIGALASAVGGKIAEGNHATVAIVTLGSDSYKHKEYGKIYVPEFVIERWVTTASIVADVQPVKGKGTPTPPLTKRGNTAKTKPTAKSARR